MRFYTVKQVAEILAIHPRTVQNLIRRGDLGAVKVGQQWRISPEQLEAFIEKGRTNRPK